MRMHRLICVLTCLILPIGIPAGFAAERPYGAVAYRQTAQPGRGAEDVARLSRVVPLGESGALDVSNISGQIVIRSGTGTDAVIEAVKRARGASPDEAARQLEAVTIDIQERTQLVEIRTIYDRQVRNIRVSVDYDIVVPPGTRVTARSVSGGVRVTGVEGDLRVESVSGHLRIENARRLGLAKSVSGRVEVSDVSADGGLTISTVSGQLSARNVRARSLDAGSVSGRVELLDVTADRVTARSVSGSVRFEGTLARGGHYELRSHSGSLRIGVGGPGGFELDASTFSGTVRTDLPITRVGDAPADDRRSRTNRIVRGTSGDGSARLALTTFSGSIVVSPLP